MFVDHGGGKNDGNMKPSLRIAQSRFIVRLSVPFFGHRTDLAKRRQLLDAVRKAFSAASCSEFEFELHMTIAFLVALRMPV